MCYYYESTTDALLDDPDALKNAIIDVKTSSSIDEHYDENGFTLLHCAVACDRRDIVELLLRCGADPNAEVEKEEDDDDDADEAGRTPLHFALSESVAELLLGLPDDGRETFWRASANKIDANGRTPFDGCVLRENVGMARFFLRHTTDVTVGDAQKDVTAGCSLAMKIVELESRSTNTDGDAAIDAGHRASALEDLLPEFAKRTNLDAIVADARAYTHDNEDVMDPRVYALLSRLFFLNAVHTRDVFTRARAAARLEGPKPKVREG